jgi:hypothetical protein
MRVHPPTAKYRATEEDAFNVITFESDIGVHFVI